jgi:hypothetical protein
MADRPLVRRNYAVMDTKPADVAAIVASFNADYAGTG